MKSIPGLTPRLQRVLQLVAGGHANDAIAQRLALAPRSVQRYLSRIYELFGGTSRYNMVVRASRRGAVVIPRDGIRPHDAAALTPTEIAVGQSALQLHTNQEIATHLGMSAGSVLSSLTLIRRKMNRPTKLAALDRAVELGYLRGASPTTLRTPLSRREAAILRRLGTGWSHRDIALDLDTSKSNISGRIAALRAKFRVRTSEQLLDVVDRLHLLLPAGRAAHVDRTAMEQLRNSPRAPALTPRQLDVLDAFHRFPNWTHNAIADYLNVSKAAVDAHSVALRRRFGRFGARNRQDLITRSRAYARRSA